MDIPNNNNTQSFTVDNIRQLIDLNGDQTNFELEFAVESENKEPFEMIVLDQTTLDSQEPLNYKQITNGYISGRIVADKNIYQNYFMVLRAENPVTCHVTTNLKPLPYIQPPQPPQPPQEPKAPVPPPKEEDNGKSWLRYILIGLVVVGGAMLIYHFYKKSQNKNEQPSLPPAEPVPVIVPSVIPKASPKISPKIHHSKPPRPKVPTKASRRRRVKVVSPHSSSQSSSVVSSAKSSPAPAKTPPKASPVPAKTPPKASPIAKVIPKASPVPSLSSHSSHSSSRHSTPAKKPTFNFGKKPNQDLINRLKGLPVS